MQDVDLLLYTGNSQMIYDIQDVDLLLYSGNSQEGSTTSRMSTYYCTRVIHRDDLRHPGCRPIIVLG